MVIKREIVFEYAYGIIMNEFLLSMFAQLERIEIMYEFLHWASSCTLSNIQWAN